MGGYHPGTVEHDGHADRSFGENLTGMRVIAKELLPDSGGPGEFWAASASASS